MRRWLTTTNHKDIGTLYLLLSLVLLLVAGAFAMAIRAELLAPGLQVVNAQRYNELVALHGFIMIFGAIVPALVGLANWQVPLMIGAPDLALPRVNNFSFWLLPFAFVLLLASLLFPGATPDFGWTGYAPLSAAYSSGTAVYVFTIHLTSLSSILAGINLIATIVTMRAPGMGLLNMPLFVWTILITALLMLIAMPVLGAAATMLLTDRYFGTTFFDAAGGGDPRLWQHLFWFFGHPEVYIMILPAFGVISQVIPTFARKALFGYRYMVYSIVAIGFLSMLVWAHHMFTVDMPVEGEMFFMYATMLIAIPTGVKIFNWVSTLWRGSLSFETPMLFALAFLFMFTVGGLSGVMLAAVPADVRYHDTHFVVAHLHYVVVAGSLFAIFAGVYFWLPKWTGRMYDERLGQAHFWLTAIGMNLTFFPLHFLGLAGMPRRIPDYALQFADFNALSSLAAFGLGAAQLLFVAVVVKAMFGRGEPVGSRVWDGADGLEWELPSPAPHHTFERPPRVVVTAPIGVAGASYELAAGDRPGREEAPS